MTINCDISDEFVIPKSSSKHRSTISQYSHLADQLYDRTRKTFGFEETEIDPRSVAVYLTDIMDNVAPSTFRFYRAALVHRFETESTPESLEARDYLKETVNSDGEIRKRAGGNVTKKGPGRRRLKVFPKKTLVS